MMNEAATTYRGRPDPLTRVSRRALHAVRSWPAASYIVGPLAVAARDRGRGRPILVHQMGKVASTAIVKTLEGVTERPVYHTHFLSSEGIEFAKGTYQGNWGVGGLPWHVFESMWVSRQLGGGPRWDVVTVVRDPVAKNISGFFQIAKLQYGLDPAAVTVESLREHYLGTYDEHDRPLNWVDLELDAVFGTDTFAQPFPTEQGWQLIESDRARVAIIRYEDLAHATGPALKALLNYEVGELASANKSSNKAYGTNQAAVTDSLVLPDAYLDMMYESKYASHFYSEAERDEMRARWAER